MESHHGAYVLTDDPARVDLDVVCALLSDTYWAATRSREQIASSIENSLCVSVFHDAGQVGIARVLPDRGASSSICDVVIDPAHRGKGIGKWLMSCVLRHPAVAGTRALLITRDAQPFYRELGFVTHPYECMVKTEAAE